MKHHHLFALVVAFIFILQPLGGGIPARAASPARITAFVASVLPLHGQAAGSGSLASATGRVRKKSRA